jgi:hypothetical protein
MPIRVSVKEKPQRKGVPGFRDPNKMEDTPKRRPPKFRRSPDPRSRGEFLTGGQAKLDKNKNNRIDAEDFKILRGEKKKPGKMMKARRGTIIKPRGPGVIRPKPQDRYGQPMKPKPIKPRIQKKMGGGMMKKPMGYKKGSKKEMEIKKFVKKHGTFPYVKPKKKMGGGMMMQKPMAYYGGGMMMRPNPIGMKSGKSVKVKCKLGRNKPTKMY